MLRLSRVYTEETPPLPKFCFICLLRPLSCDGKGYGEDNLSKQLKPWQILGEKKKDI